MFSLLKRFLSQKGQFIMQNRFSPCLTHLEDRNLLSGSTVELVGGVLKLEGGDGFSDISVEQFDETQLIVFADDQTYFFNAEDVRVIQFNSSAEGGDRFSNFTDEKSISHLSGEDNVVVGGTYFDIVIDDANFTVVESNGGIINYVDTNRD